MPELGQQIAHGGLDAGETEIKIVRVIMLRGKIERIALPSRAALDIRSAG